MIENKRRRGNSGRAYTYISQKTNTEETNTQLEEQTKASAEAIIDQKQNPSPSLGILPIFTSPT